MKTGERIIDPLLPYIMYEFTGKTETQNNMGHFQTLYEVKKFIKGEKDKWELHKIEYMGECYLNFLKTN